MRSTRRDRRAGLIASCGCGPAVDSLEERRMLAGDPVTSSAFIFSTTASTVPTAIDGDGGQFTPQTAQSASLISMDDFRADPRFAGIDGRTFSTVILDTGIDRNHPFFGPDANGNGVSDRIVYSYDFANNDADASDVNGHGSNVSSIVASSDSTHRGIAPGANIIHLKVFLDSGGGNFSYTERALQWCVANANTYNIASINMSLGDSQNWSSAQSLYGCADEIAALAAMNVIVVSAAGNSFSSFGSQQGVAYPAADPNSLAVGAVYDGNVGGFSYGSGASASTTGPDRITPFSQRHSTLTEIFAPGAPITGAGPTGGTVTQHGTSQAAPHIAGIAVLAQQLAVQVLGRRLTLAEFTNLIRTSGDTIVDGDDENDNVTNTGLSFKRINALALGEAILAMAPSGPEITVTVDGAAVLDGATTVSFGSRFITSTASKTFTISNTGTAALALGNAITLPAGYTVTTGFQVSSLDPGDSTTITVRYDAASAGAAAGTLSFTCDDANENTFNFTITGTAATSEIADDGNSPHWASVGTWTAATTGYRADSRYAAPGTGTRTATWTFSSLPDGNYRVSVTYSAHTNRASNATYTIRDGDASGSLVKTRAISQRTAANDRSASGYLWEDIGSVNIESGTMTVRLTDTSTGYVVADAVRIERLRDPVYFSEVSVARAATAILDGGSFAYGSTAEGSARDYTFTVTNSGTVDLTLDDLAVPSGFQIVSDFASATVAPDQSTTFTVRLTAAALGAYSGTLSFTTNDSDEGTFNFTVSGTVTGYTAVMDDGAAGHSFAGTWTSATGGYSSDQRYRAGAGVAGGANTSVWAFTGLAAGTYRVSASWSMHTNRATNAPYAVVDGTTSGTLLTTRLINQRVAPNDRSVSATWFEDLGTFAISGSTLTVRLSDAANGFVIADAIRIERVA